MRMPWRATEARAEVPVVDREQRDEKADSSFDKEAVAGEPRAVDNDSEEFTPNAQDGVKKIEATTTVWTTRDLIIAYVL